MHLKILITLVTLGLSTVGAKAKGSPQGFINVPVSFFPGYGLVQNFGAQQFPAQAAVPYSVGFAFGNNNVYPAHAFRGSIFLNPQTNQAQNYQQQFPGVYPSAPSQSYAVQSANNFGRLWPKNLVNPNGTPSPPISGPDPLNYVIVSSTPSPLPQSTSNYNSFVRNSQQSVSSTLRPSPAPYQQLIPVPVNIDTRNSFQPDVVRFPNGQVVPNTPIITSTIAPYVANQQKNPFLSALQNLQIVASPAPFIANFQPTAAPFLFQYQQPSASPFAFQQVPPSPFPYLISNFQQTTQSPLVNNRVNYNPQPSPPTYLKQNQQSTVFPLVSPNLASRSNFIDSYQKPNTTPSPYQNLVKNQQPPASFPFVVQQSTAAPFVGNYQPALPLSLQQQAAAISNVKLLSQLQSNPSPVVPYQEPTTAPYIENDETTPTVLIGQHKTYKSPAQNQIESDTTKSTTPATTKAHAKTHSVTIVSTTPIPQSTTVTEESLLKSTTPTPVTLRPEIIKTEYSGLVSPQYNHITSTPSTTRSSYGPLVGQPAYVPLTNVNGYSSTAVSQFNYDSLRKYRNLNSNKL